jgi:beta-barrel assembly-enhancing protease
MTAPRLENRLPPEDLHGRDEHPLRELAWLLGASAALLLGVVLVVSYGAQWLAPRLPFSAEQALADNWLPERELKTDEERQRRAALQALADRVAAQMALPPGMQLVLSDEPSPLVNAYATLGGRIRIFHGLLARLPSEEALAALLAHEIAHVKHRHVAANMGRGLALAVALSVVSADAGAAAAEWALGQAASLALLGYSRDQETQADAEALAASVALYGHAGGLQQLFEQLGQVRQDQGLELLQTHPFTAARLQFLKDEATRQGWPLHGPSTPLPAALRVKPAPR